MNINNLERASEIRDELRSTVNAIEQARQLVEDKCGFLLAENVDCSGICVQHVFKSGGIAPFYQEIAEFTVERLEAYHESLLKEIKEL